MLKRLSVTVVLKYSNGRFTDFITEYIFFHNCGRDCIVVGFTTTCAINPYHHKLECSTDCGKNRLFSLYLG